MPLTNPALVNVSAGTLSSNLSAITFSNSNGVSFGLNGATLTGTVATNYMASASSSVFARTGFTTASTAGSDIVGTHDTVGLNLGIPKYLTTAALSQDSSLYRFTSADTQLRFTSADSQLRFTSADSQLQFTSANTKFVQEWQLLGAQTAGTTSSAQGSQLYLSGDNMMTMSGNSNTIVLSVNTASLLGTGATASFRHTSADTQLRFTSADSQLRFTSADSQLRFTSADSQLRFTSADSQLVFTSAIATDVKPVQSSGSTGTITRYAPEDHAHQGVAGWDVNAIASTFYGTQQFSASGAFLSIATGGNTSRGTVQIINLLSTGTVVSSVTSANVVGTNSSRFALEDHQHAGLYKISVGGNTAGGDTSAGPGSFMLAGGPNITLSGATALGGMTLSVSAAAAGGAATYSNFYQPFSLDENTATSTGSLSQLGVQPFTIPANLSFGQINLIGSATVVPTSASNNFSVRLTNSTQAMLCSSVYTITNDNLVDAFLFSRGTGVFSSELETFASTRNSFRTIYNATYRGSVTLTNTAGGSMKLSQSISMSISYPGITSATATSINPASTYTSWATGYTTWTSTATNELSATYSTSAAKATAIASTYPATALWSSNKMVLLNFATSLIPGEYWLGIVRYSNTSSSSNSGASFTGAAGTGNSFTATYNASNLTQTAMLTWAGMTHSVLSSLGWLGMASQATMAADPGLGTFSAAWERTATYLNNLGNPAGAVAFSQINTGANFFRSWFQMASNRI